MKQYHQYQMNFTGKAAYFSGIFMGLSVFALAVYYLAIRNMSDIGRGELVICFWLPLVLGVVYIALLNAVRWNAPGLYAIFGVLFCVLHILSAFVAGGFFRIMLDCIVYVICAAVLLVVMGGYFPARLPASLCFAIALVLRIVLFDIGRLSTVEWIQETAPLCVLASLMCLPVSVKPVKK